ncbi:hypothetical protein [Sandaracinus amylolyticus]|uniref:hypothetical protein n=1 Tax=Sandaracinus amylolyticus TaxID=927083 RepID=UPI001F3B61DB|nr:hypothetical protein [Sandaracinus amylolyticus]
MELENRIGQPTSGGLGSRRDLEQQAKHQAENAKEQIRSLAEHGKDRLAEQLEHIAHAVRGTGDNLRGDEQAGDLSQYADSLGDQIDRASRYLREHRAIDLVDGVERFARTQPALFLGGAFAFGLVLGRFFKSSPDGGTTVEEGYAMGGYDVGTGYPEAESVVTSPVQPVGTPVTTPGNTPSSSFGSSYPSAQSPSTAYPYSPPSGTFGGGSSGGGGGDNQS